MKKEILKSLYKYILLLIVAAALCVGTVFARYSSGGSGSANTEIAAMGCSYSIDLVSSTAFSNATWPTTTGELGFNTPQSITFTVNNFIDDKDNYSSTDVQAVFRFTIPYALLSDMAVQMVQVSDAGVQSAATPQYDIAHIIEAATYGVTSYDTTEGSTVTIDGTDTYVTKYNQISGADEQSLTLSYTTDKITAVAADGYTLTLRNSGTTSNLKLGYTRSKTDDVTGNASTNFYASEFIVESTSTEMSTLLTEWYLDISIPAMYFETGAGDSRTFMFYFTPLTKQDYNASYNASNNQMYYTTTVVDGGGNATTSYTYDNIKLNETVYGVSIESLTYNVGSVNLYTNADCTEGQMTGTVRVIKSGTSYDYYYFDSNSLAYTQFALIDNSTTVYSANIDLNGTATTVYLNTQEAINVGTANVYSNADCTADEASAVIKMESIGTGSGTVNYYCYDDSTAEYVQLALSSGTVYTGTVGGEAIYYDSTKAFTVSGEFDVYSDSGCETVADTATIKRVCTNGEYTYYHSNNGTDTVLTQSSGNVYYCTITGTSTTTFYFDISALTDLDYHLNNPLKSYDGSITYEIGTAVSSIYYSTYAQVVFVQASVVNTAAQANAEVLFKEEQYD